MEDLLPAPPLGRALGFGLGAAFAGAAAWALLLIYGQMEHGLLAWGIGALVGAAIVKGGGHGRYLAASAGVLALLSIGTGKHISYRVAVGQVVDGVASPESYEERRQEATAWVALGDKPTDEQLVAFAEAHGYEPGDIDEFREDLDEPLRQFAQSQPTYEEWRAETQAIITGSFSFVSYLQEDFHPLDILFAVLGIATAFGLVTRATDRMQSEAWQKARAERQAADEAAGESEPE